MDTMKSKKLINERTARSERGAAMIDYAILVSMVAVVSLGSLMAFGNNIQKIFCQDIMKIAYISEKKIPVISWDEEDEEHKSCVTPYGEHDGPLF